MLSLRRCWSALSEMFHRIDDRWEAALRKPGDGRSFLLSSVVGLAAFLGGIEMLSADRATHLRVEGALLVVFGGSIWASYWVYASDWGVARRAASGSRATRWAWQLLANWWQLVLLVLIVAQLAHRI
jgi:hypothetical protein